MVFRWKILLFILAAIFLLNLGTYLTSRYTLFHGYVEIEERHALDHLERIRNILEDDLDALISTNVDWSAWDDSYDFVVSKDKEYIESNLVPSTFDELELDAIVLLDANSNIVYAMGYDPEAGDVANVPAGLLDHLQSPSKLVRHADPETRIAGILSLPQGPFLISSCPIIRSDMSGPVRGAFIMGRFLDEGQLERLGKQTKLSLSLVPAEKLTSDSKVFAAEQQLRIFDERTLKGIVGFADIYGQPAFGLGIEIPRDISQQGRATLQQFFLWGLFITLMCAAGIYLIVDRWLTNREERLESEERFKLIFVHSEAGMCTLASDGKLQQVNSAFCRIIGYDEGEVLGQYLPDFVNPIDRAWIASFFNYGHKSHGVNGSFECRLVHKSGKTFWGKVSISWVHSGSRRKPYAILMVQDLSARKKVEDQLKMAVNEARDAQQRTRAILKSAADGLIQVDRELKIRMVNPSTEELLGLSSNEMTHRPFDSVIESEPLMALMKNILKEKSPGGFCDVEIPGVDMSDTRYVRFYASPVVGQSGKRDSIILSLHDRTLDKEMERLKNDFIVTAAHELRSPLSVVQGYSQLLLEEHTIGHQDRQAYLGYIYEKSLALENIIGDLLDMERISSGRKFDVRLKRVNLQAWLEPIVRQYERSWTEHRFYLELPDEIIYANIDARKLEQVLNNLLDNAVKYSPVGGEIRVKGELLGDEIRLTVEDRGVGMTADELERVFEMFYRARATSGLADGIGIGLTISREIVEAHGGRIWLKSVYGEGTWVYMSLPVPD